MFWDVITPIGPPKRRSSWKNFWRKLKHFAHFFPLKWKRYITAKTPYKWSKSAGNLTTTRHTIFVYLRHFHALIILSDWLLKITTVAAVISVQKWTYISLKISDAYLLKPRQQRNNRWIYEKNQYYTLP